VREHRAGEGLDVVGDDVVPPVERRPRPPPRSRCSAARGDAPEPQLWRGPGGRAERDDVLLHLPGDEHAADGLDERPHVERAATGLSWSSVTTTRACQASRARPPRSGTRSRSGR